MNEYVLDVLLYLFENFPLASVGATGDVRADLDQAGFAPYEINGAFAWLRDTQPQSRPAIAPPAQGTLRIYTDSEQYVLSPECRGCIMHLERAGVLTPTSRERVIDRLLALVDSDNDAINVEQVKWVTLMVLSSAEDDVAEARMEALLNTEAFDTSH